MDRDVLADALLTGIEEVAEKARETISHLESRSYEASRVHTAHQLLRLRELVSRWQLGHQRFSIACEAGDLSAAREILVFAFGVDPEGLSNWDAIRAAIDAAALLEDLELDLVGVEAVPRTRPDDRRKR